MESVIKQKTKFHIEIVVGEDHSNDKTRDVLKEYREKYPDKIKLLFRERNIGMIQNFIDTLEKCNGKYIALLEGDDYWTDSSKLQRQVDFLEAHPDFSFCFHNTKVIDENIQKEYLSNDSNQKKTNTVKDVIKDWYIMTPSIVFRKSMADKLPEWFVKVNNGDYALQLLLAHKGEIGYIDHSMAVYRIHKQGISNVFKSKIYYFNSLRFLFNQFNQHTEYKYNLPIKKRLFLILFKLVRKSILEFLYSCYRQFSVAKKFI